MDGVPSTHDRQVYEDLRGRLIDRTRRNRLLHFTHGPRASLVRLVDASFDEVVQRLRDEKSYGFKPLPDPEPTPDAPAQPVDREAWARAHGVNPSLELAAANLQTDDRHQDDWLRTLLLP